MFSMMAVVARPWFEADDGDKVEGDVVDWKTYRADHLPLQRLRDFSSNRLYLVTVRPSTFAVWLVAVYEDVTRRDGAWTSARRNRTPIVDLTSVLDGLTFESGKGVRVSPSARPQALQAPRVLTPKDIVIIHDQIRLQGALPPADSGDLADLVGTLEGGRLLKTHLVRERNTRLRALAREHWRRELGELRCIACSFSFAGTYGPVGDDFIELHHVRPLGRRKKRTRSTPADLVPLCSNCHRMVHRASDGKPLAIAALRTLIRRRRKRPAAATVLDAEHDV
jgi:5-methylcytosine-specific restriction endonuclease McrA